MHKNSPLFSSAALGVLIVVGMSAVAPAADAAAKKHHKAHAVAAAPGASAEEVRALTEQVQALTAKLQAQEQATQALQAQAQQATATAAEAQASARSANDQLRAQIDTIPGAVKSEIAAEKPKPTWIDNTHIGATVFADLSNISQSPTPNKINGTGADIKRAYLIVDHTFNDIYSANLTVDFAPNGIVLNGGALQGTEAIKYAYIQAKYADALVLQLGAEKTPWIPFVEDIYGYRFIDKVMIDQNKFGNSSDWGLNAHGSFDHDLVEYSMSVVDGDGYKTPQRSQTMDFEGRANINWKGFVAGVGGYTGTLSNNLDTVPPTAFQTASRIDGLLAYTNDRFRLGLEYFESENWKVVTKVTRDQSSGYSVFGSFNVIPEWSVFGRYDSLDPSEKIAPLERYGYYNIGVNFEPAKTVDLALVFKHEEVRDAANGGYTDNTTILAPSSTTAHPVSGNFNEVGVYTQFKF